VFIDAEYRPDIGEPIEARLAPFHVKDDPGTGPYPEDLGAAPTPLVLAPVEC
jgi:hypothetical protein